jgi:hypothetical protein
MIARLAARTRFTWITFATFYLFMALPIAVVFFATPAFWRWLRYTAREAFRGFRREVCACFRSVREVYDERNRIAVRDDTEWSE